MAYVYLIHFETPNHHAEHYTGSCRDLQRRLDLHRAGRGSALLAHLARAGKPWQLAALYTGPLKAARNAEAIIKAAHNGPRYCPLCSGQTPKLPYVDWIEELPTQQLMFDATPSGQTEITRPRSDEQKRLAYVACTALADEEEECKPLFHSHFAKLTIATAKLDDRIVGYITWLDNKVGYCINALLVADPYRLLGIGSDLVAYVQSLAPFTPLHTSLPADNPSHGFLTKLGFEALYQAANKTTYYRRIPT